MDNCNDWALDVFGGADLGDLRRTGRLVAMGAQAARHPSGRISEVFQTDAERQGAYDFVESPHFGAEAMRCAISSSTAERCSTDPWVYVPVDGTSLTLWDGTGEKDFGAIGTYRSRATGIKLYNAIAVDSSGAPVGVAAQVWWRRPRERVIRKRRRADRPGENETEFLLKCIDQVTAAFAAHAPHTRCWFQIDRGGDARLVLWHLDRSSHWFTVRANADRRLRSQWQPPLYLRETLRRQPVLGYLRVELPRTNQRPARVARMAVRSSRIFLSLRNPWDKQRPYLAVNAVLVCEERPEGLDRIEWLLLTNHPAASLSEAHQVIRGYMQRWRIEDFHKTWKTGACNVEHTQLRESERVIRWATLLSAVAARVERLKHLSRTEPQMPASVEFLDHEIEALVLLHTRRKKRNEIVPDQPTIGQATLWIAQLGGYTGKSSGGPPGAITLARGLERLQPAAELLQIMKGSKMR
jgi:hypothetical protein